LTRSNASTRPDRLRSIRSRLILGMLLPYVCLMGVCAVVLFTGPAGTDRFPAVLVLVGAAVLLPAAMARIPRGILGQAEALETERATLAGDPVDRTDGAGAPAEPVVEKLAAPAPDPDAEVVPEPAEAVIGAEDVAPEAIADVIDEDAPLAAAVVVESGVDAAAVDEGGPFAAFLAADRGPWAVPGADHDAIEDSSAETPVAVADDEVPGLAQASDDGVVSEAVEDEAPIAAAVATPDPATEDGTETAPDADPESAPRPMLVPSAIGRQILTGTPAEPAA
jgi:hypothetical protein